MTEYSRSSIQSSKNLRRQPKQQRGKDRVEKILDAAAAVFDEIGYPAATTHLIAAKAGTAIGSLYQFFPDKAAIFKAMELRHAERVEVFWSQAIASGIVQLPLRQMLHNLVMAVSDLFEQPVSRVMFVQFYTAPENFQAIDESMTQEAINFMANILIQRNSALEQAHGRLLAEVCVHSSNAVMLAALRAPDVEARQQLTQQIEELLVSYLEPHVGDNRSNDAAKVMKVMKCPHCQSEQLSKNGYRRGKQCYRCKMCEKQFVESRLPTEITQ
ncbi:TetR/AcrR family transcriptional regulator [Sivoneniella epilithica]